MIHKRHEFGVKPMLASLASEPFDNDKWLFEIKWDGYRVIAIIKDSHVQLLSRNGLILNEKFPEIVEALQSLNDEAILDGEIVALDNTGKPHFQYLQDYPRNKRGDLIFYVFDLLELNGKNLKKTPLLERKNKLTNYIANFPNLVASEYIVGKGKDFFDAAKKQGLEGIMAKKMDSYYQEGERSIDWLKIKTTLRQEAVIGGFTKPRGSREKFGALVLGVYSEGKLKYIGHTGSGFDENSLNTTYKRLTAIKQKESPFYSEPQTNTPVTWVKPEIVCEVKFLEWTEEGLMRQPVFLGLREDKDPKEVTKEIVPVNKIDKTSVLDVGGQNVNISHINKVFWPDEGYTKGDLIDYYRHIAPVLLPYLVDKPESLLRFPDGIFGESFFQKDMKILPDWIDTVKVQDQSANKEIKYMICNDEASLIYMINLGCIDINPWNSRIKNISNPDYLIIDLDPEGVPFAKVTETAIGVREVLGGLDIEGFCKTSGASGIHIYIPMGGLYTYEQVRDFAQILAEKIYQKLPNITSLERSPEKRQGKVYIDVFQNAKGQTLACPYCVRPRPMAPVSTPLAWEELNSRMKPTNFTIKNMLQRLEKKEDLFRPVLGKGVNIGRVLKKLSQSD